MVMQCSACLGEEHVTEVAVHIGEEEYVVEEALSPRHDHHLASLLLALERVLHVRVVEQVGEACKDPT
jgi:hypothetical protein